MAHVLDPHTWEKIELNQLSQEEKNIIIDKWTEHPRTWEYDQHFDQWTYLCRQCNAPLYRSQNKFDAHCGRPAFDDAIPWAIRWQEDIHSSGTEIVCKRCGAHLWHAFVGEQFTKSNVRHCVNSLSMKFVPEHVASPQNDIAVFWWGCFWCIEAVFQKLQWVLDVQSGYAWGHVQYPTYEQVTKQDTGHAEVVRIFFDPSIISYEQLLLVFFTVHNPTTLNQQWADHWTQYRSIILYNSSQQKETAATVIQKPIQENRYPDPIVTEVVPLETFWLADGSHQNFYNNHPKRVYCQVTIDPKIAKLKQQWQHLLQ